MKYFKREEIKNSCDFSSLRYLIYLKILPFLKKILRILRILFKVIILIKMFLPLRPSLCINCTT